VTTPAEPVERARQRWNAGDLPGYLTLYAEDLRFHGVGLAPMDKPSVTGFYRQFWSAMGRSGRPGPQLDFHEHLADGDLYSCRFAVSGEHRGDFMGVPATGRPFVLEGITIMHFGGDQVVERWTTSDFLGLMVQLGAVPVPA
jgi:predicted ester cyclase